MFAVLGFLLVGANIVRPRRNIKKLFLSYFSVTKSTKSHLRGFSILLKNSFRVHELVARAVRGKCVRQRTKRKSAVSRSSQPHTTTCANIAHEKAEQIRARIVCTPAEKRWAGVGKFVR